MSLPFLYLLVATDLWIEGVKVTSEGVETILGPAYLWWGLFTGVNVPFFFYPLWTRRKNARGLEKAQIQFFFYGIILMVSGIMILDLVLPLVFGSTKYFWASSLFTLVLIAFTTYAIVKHRFMDIRLALRATLSRFLMVTFLALIFFNVGMLFATGTLQSSRTTIILMSIGLAIFFIVLLKPLERALRMATDKIFFQREYSRQEILRSLFKTMAESINLQELEQKIQDTLKTTMQVHFVRFVLNDQQDNLLFQHIQGQPEMIVYAELPHDLEEMQSGQQKIQLEKLKEQMCEEKIGVVLPLMATKGVIGMILMGEKRGGEVYTSADLEILETLMYQAGVAINNAQLYQQTQEFNVTLEDKVQQATADLRKAYEELKTLDKMKDELIGITSHELRTPMTSIKSYLWMILNKKKDLITDPSALKYLTRSYESADRMIKLVNDMLTVTEIEGGKIQMDLIPQKIEPVIEQVMSELSVTANEKKVQLAFTKSEQELPDVSIDADRMREVLTNLISNAIKYSPEQGLVTISAIQKDKMIEVCVQDTGKGISKEDQERLFKKFGRLEGSFVSAAEAGGTGLGLYICKSIVELHKGRIWVESLATAKATADKPEGKGSKFSFSLPIGKEDSSKSL